MMALSESIDARLTFVGLAVICLSLCLAACDSSDSSGNSDATTAPTTAAAATAAPATPNPDELSGMTLRFFKDVTNYDALPQLVSPHFLQANKDRWLRDYGYIDSPRVQVNSVHDSAVDYTVDYDYLAKSGVKILWERSGEMTFIHGSMGWRLDTDSWKSIHIVGIVANDGTTTPIHDQVFADGHHTFTWPPFGSFSYSATKDSWSIASVATPAPPPSQSDNSAGSTPNYAPSYNTPPYYAPPPPAAGTNCEEVGISGVYQDGEILELDDGRHLRVESYDTPTSSVWVAPFDGLICNDDKLINKDDNESVDLAP